VFETEGKIKRLGAAEAEIMDAVWSFDRPVGAHEILEAVKDRRNWQLSTLMTSLSRLCAKDFLICDRTQRNNLYCAKIGRQAYAVDESRRFLRLHSNSVPQMVACLYEGKAIGKKELEQLKDLVEHLSKTERED